MGSETRKDIGDSHAGPCGGRWGRVLALAALAWVGGWTASADSLAGNDRLNFAHGLYARGMHEFAIREYSAFLQEFPDHAQVDVAHFRRGMSRLERDEIELAKQDFAAVFERHPESEFQARAGFRLAHLHRQTGRGQQAAAVLQDLIALDPADEMASAAWYGLGELLLERGEEEAALRTFERVRRSYPGQRVHPYALLQLGRLYGEGAWKDVERAQEIYQAVIDDPPSERLAAEAWYQLATLLYRQKNPAAAAQAYRTLLDRYPGDERIAQARLHAAWSAHHAGLHAEALKMAETALAIGMPGPEEAASWLYLKANSERQLERHEDSASTYRTLLERFPDSAMAGIARFESAVAHYKAGQFAEALNQARNVPATPAIEKDLHWLMAESSAALERRDEAIQYYRLVLENHADSSVAPDAAFRLARELRADGNYRSAALYYRRVAEDWPDHALAPRALYAAGLCRKRDGQRAEAVRDWDTLARQYPEDRLAESALYQKAMNEIRLGRDETARQTLESLLRKYPETEHRAEASHWKGVLLKQAGNFADAEPLLRAALDSDPRRELRRETVFHLADVLRERGEEREAAALLQDLLDTAVADRIAPAVLQWLAQYWHGAEAYERSAAAARALTQRDAPAARQAGWALAGRAHAAREEWAEARHNFEQALAEEIRSEFAAESALRLGEIALQEERYADAVPFFEQAAGMVGEDEFGRTIRASGYAGLGEAYQGQGAHEQAARFFMSVAVLYDDPELAPRCLVRAAQSWEALGRDAEAARARAELRERYPDSAFAARLDLDDEEEPDAHE